MGTCVMITTYIDECKRTSSWLRTCFHLGIIRDQNLVQSNIIKWSLSCSIRHTSLRPMLRLISKSFKGGNTYRCMKAIFTFIGFLCVIHCSSPSGYKYRTRNCLSFVTQLFVASKQIFIQVQTKQLTYNPINLPLTFNFFCLLCFALY